MKELYKILALLKKYNGDESFDYALISASAMKMTYGAWEQLMIQMQGAGYIDGIMYTKSMTDKFPHIVEPIFPRITLKGIEYLEENSAMAKAKEALRMIGEII